MVVDPPGGDTADVQAPSMVWIGPAASRLVATQPIVHS